MRNELKDLIESLKQRWLDLQKVKTGWFSTTVSRFSLAIPFFLKAIDELMKFVAKFQMEGVGKKAIVMEALGELYTFIIQPLLPIWLKPFGSSIRELILDVLVSSFIDFLVARLRENQPL